MIKLIVGLGNPGVNYQFNRHNVGFWLVDYLANIYAGVWKKEIKFSAMICKIIINNEQVILIKPTTYMNNSGTSVSSLLNFFKINPDQVLVAHDEIDLPICIKFKTAGGHGGHNGLRDIVSKVGKDFHRIRIGIDRPNNNSSVADFVLTNPSKKEQEKIIQNIINFLELIPNFINGDLNKAVHKLHTS